MKDTLRKAVVSKSEQELLKCLDFRQTKKITSHQYDLIEKALVGTWHSQHEDLVNIIYLENLRDDRFVDPIFNIAIKRDVYRWYDDELETTLRKCVHALKTIDSKKIKCCTRKIKGFKKREYNA